MYGCTVLPDAVLCKMHFGTTPARGLKWRFDAPALIALPHTDIFKKGKQGGFDAPVLHRSPHRDVISV
jgi:hypothetical protein